MVTRLLFAAVALCALGAYPDRRSSPRDAPVAALQGEARAPAPAARATALARSPAAAQGR
jgi:hypothetical protein